MSLMWVQVSSTTLSEDLEMIKDSLYFLTNASVSTSIPLPYSDESEGNSTEYKPTILSYAQESAGRHSLTNSLLREILPMHQSISQTTNEMLTLMRSSPSNGLLNRWLTEMASSLKNLEETTDAIRESLGYYSSPMLRSSRLEEEYDEQPILPEYKCKPHHRGLIYFSITYFLGFIGLNGLYFILTLIVIGILNSIWKSEPIQNVIKRLQMNITKLEAQLKAKKVQNEEYSDNEQEIIVDTKEMQEREVGLKTNQKVIKFIKEHKRVIFSTIIGIINGITNMIYIIPGIIIASKILSVCALNCMIDASLYEVVDCQYVFSDDVTIYELKEAIFSTYAGCNGGEGNARELCNMSEKSTYKNNTGVYLELAHNFFDNKNNCRDYCITGYQYCERASYTLVQENFKVVNPDGNSINEEFDNLCPFGCLINLNDKTLLPYNQNKELLNPFYIEPTYSIINDDYPLSNMKTCHATNHASVKGFELSHLPTICKIPKYETNCTIVDCQDSTGYCYDRGDNTCVVILDQPCDMGSGDFRNKLIVSCDECNSQCRYPGRGYNSNCPYEIKRGSEEILSEDEVINHKFRDGGHKILLGIFIVGCLVLLIGALIIFVIFTIWMLK